MMSHFARFYSRSEAVFRLDTRVYLAECKRPGPEDKCIAAVIAKNPGSAIGKIGGALVPVDLNGGKLLATVRRRFIAAYKLAGKRIVDGEFVQIWNLFYLCNPRLREAIQEVHRFNEPLSCRTETRFPPIVWFAWGGPHPCLDLMKKRFKGIRNVRPFFFDKNKQRIVCAIPRNEDFAKHPQGLRARPIEEFLAKQF